MVDENIKENGYVLVTFPEKNSSLFNIEIVNINVGQLFALSGYLEEYARIGLAQERAETLRQAQAQQKPKIEVPTPKIELGKK